MLPPAAPASGPTTGGVCVRGGSHSVKTFADALMSAEADALCDAEYGQVSDERVNSRNGYRPREWNARAGTGELAIPKLRQGSYFPHWLLERRRRAEQPLISVVATAHLLGVSTPGSRSSLSPSASLSCRSPRSGRVHPARGGLCGAEVGVFAGDRDDVPGPRRIRTHSCRGKGPVRSRCSGPASWIRGCVSRWRAPARGLVRASGPSVRQRGSPGRGRRGSRRAGRPWRGPCRAGPPIRRRPEWRRRCRRGW